ncbi:MAG: adenylate cyclase, partial [Myxococcota bacterium]
EEPVDQATFDQLWPLTEGARVFKKRHRIEDGDDVWEIDVFTDRELVLAEIELESEDREVRLPAWLKPYVEREVTLEKGFVNQRLAR